MPKPTISSVYPSSVNSGDTVTINGTGLDQGGTPTVRFDSTLVTVINTSPTQVFVTAPLIYLGNHSVTVQNSGGTSDPFNSIYVTPPLPHVTSWTNNAIPNQSVGINGENFFIASDPTVTIKKYSDLSEYSLLNPTYYQAFNSVVGMLPVIPAGLYYFKVVNGLGGGVIPAAKLQCQLTTLSRSR